MKTTRVQIWASRLVQKFRIDRPTVSGPTIEAPWTALEGSSLLQDLHDVSCAINQAAGRVVLQEERRRRPFLCPSQYVFFNKKTAYVMRLEIGPSQLCLVFSTERVGRFRNRVLGQAPLRKERRRLVLSTAMLNDAPIGACFGFLLSGFAQEEWIALCSGGVTNGEVAKLMPPREAPVSSVARTQAAARRALMKAPAATSQI